MNKISNKLQRWKGKLLSFGCRAILIKHVFQSININRISIIYSPMNILNTIKRIFTQSFSSSAIGGNGRLQDVFTALLDYCRMCFTALFPKLRCNIRTIKSIWSSYMYNKYCKKAHPTK